MSTISTTRELDRPRRLLLLANEALADETIGVVVARHAAGRTEVLVVAPALGSRLELWMSDDRPRRAAEERLERCLAKLAVAGIEAEGLVGDADPLLAVDDALRLFPADEIVVATGSPARSSWLARGLVRRARLRFPQPVHHVTAAYAPEEATAA
jgi:hypothetical protein